MPTSYAASCVCVAHGEGISRGMADVCEGGGQRRGRGVPPSKPGNAGRQTPT
jgi:hypothetical protein